MISLGRNLIFELLILVWGVSLRYFEISRVILLKQDYPRLYHNDLEMIVFYFIRSV